MHFTNYHCTSISFHCIVYLCTIIELSGSDVDFDDDEAIPHESVHESDAAPEEEMAGSNAEGSTSSSSESDSEYENKSTSKSPAVVPAKTTSNKVSAMALQEEDKTS